MKIREMKNSGSEKLTYNEIIQSFQDCISRNFVKIDVDDLELLELCKKDKDNHSKECINIIKKNIIFIFRFGMTRTIQYDCGHTQILDNRKYDNNIYYFSKDRTYEALFVAFELARLNSEEMEKRIDKLT